MGVCQVIWGRCEFDNREAVFADRTIPKWLAGGCCCARFVRRSTLRPREPNEFELNSIRHGLLYSRSAASYDGRGPADDAATHKFPNALFFGRNNLMRRFFSVWILTVVIGAVVWAGDKSATAADEYAYDLVHSSVSFKARHLDISWIHGRFNEVEGKFSLDREHPAKSTFELTIKTNSIDTANQARDEHLRQPRSDREGATGDTACWWATRHREITGVEEFATRAAAR